MHLISNTILPKSNKNQNKYLKALIDQSRKVNIMYLTYVRRLSPYTKKINIGIQKISKSNLNTFEIIIADCLVKKKLEKVRFISKTFLLVNIKIEVI